MATETKQIILRTGTGVPTNLAEGELGFATDTKTLFIGTGNGNVRVLSSTDHNHDDRYYTIQNIIDLLSGKANTNHTHDYSSLSNKPTLGTISPINLPQNAAKYLKGDGSWADVPSGLANSEASFTLFSGAVTIENPSPKSINIPTSVGLLKNAVIRIKYDANGHANVTQDVAVNSSGQVWVFDDVLYGPDEGIINFSITFNLTQAVFSAYFDEGEAQSYVLREITVMYNR